jgi:hypothetical protein
MKVEGNLVIGNINNPNTNSETGSIHANGNITSDGDMTAANYYSPSTKRLKPHR